MNIFLKKVTNFFRENRDNIDYTELLKLVKQTKNVKLIDVRSNQEYNEGHLNGAICIPLYELESKINKVAMDKESLIILYCTSGVRSLKAKKILKNLGYQNVCNLKGGLDNI